MADTIVNTPRDTGESAAGWAVAAVVVIAIIIGAVLLFRNGLPGVPNTGTNIDVTLPASGGSGGTGGSGGSGGTGSGTDL